MLYAIGGDQKTWDEGAVSDFISHVIWGCLRGDVSRRQQSLSSNGAYMAPIDEKGARD
jgi:hypothetical protein